MKAGAIKEIAAHQFEREEAEHYCEPIWVDDAIFRAEKFIGEIHDPCCGFGRIPDAAMRAGYRASGSDIVNRGYPICMNADFLRRPMTPKIDNVVMNPPFNIAEKFINHACAVARGKVAAILQTRRLNAAHWMRALPLVQVWFLTPRPSMLPGHLIAVGQKAGGGIPEYCWVVFDNARAEWSRAEVGWLHRDRGVL